MTSYLPVAPRFLIRYPQRIIWSSRKRKRPPRRSSRFVIGMPRWVLPEFSRERRQTKCTLEHIPAWLGGVAPPLPFEYPAFETTLVPFMPVPIVLRRPEDMLSSPLGQHIISYEPPHGFSIPPFAMYDGSFDSYDHMMHFNQAMTLSAGNDRLLCKVLLVSLKGPALAWFYKLPKGSINLFSKLWAAFVSQYLCLVRQKGNISSLQTILKREDEFIQDFTRRFGQVVQQIDTYSMDAVLQPG